MNQGSEKKNVPTIFTPVLRIVGGKVELSNTFGVNVPKKKEEASFDLQRPLLKKGNDVPDASYECDREARGIFLDASDAMQTSNVSEVLIGETGSTFGENS